MSHRTNACNATYDSKMKVLNLSHNKGVVCHSTSANCTFFIANKKFVKIELSPPKDRLFIDYIQSKILENLLNNDIDYQKHFCIAEDMFGIPKGNCTFEKLHGAPQQKDAKVKLFTNTNFNRNDSD